MDLSKNVTQFSLEAEYEHYGMARLVKSINAMKSEVAQCRQDMARLTEELEAVKGKLLGVCKNLTEGTLLDEFGNRNDDSLQVIAARIPMGCYGIKELLNHSVRIQKIISSVEGV